MNSFREQVLWIVLLEKITLSLEHGPAMFQAHVICPFISWSVLKKKIVQIDLEKVGLKV